MYGDWGIRIIIIVIVYNLKRGKGHFSYYDRGDLQILKYIFESNCKVYVATSYGLCFYNIVGVKNKAFMLQ